MLIPYSFLFDMPPRFVRFARAAVLFLSILGALNAMYTLQLRQQLLDGTRSSSFCDISSTASCTNTLTNPQFTFFGIPFCEVALIVYPILFACALWAYRNPRAAFTALSVLGIAGILFSAYSVYIQGWIIETWCPLCLGCAVIIGLLSLFSWGARAQLGHAK